MIGSVNLVNMDVFAKTIPVTNHCQLSDKKILKNKS